MYFEFGAKIVRVIDGDTAIVDPYITPMDVVMRIRFKDVFAPEHDETGGGDATAAAQAMFPVGSEVKLTNTRAHWTYVNRLEARVDRT